jgi:sterol desaturase/sphingolipid hydroxylase (fatty acid hydroxylase superfamily)
METIIQYFDTIPSSHRTIILVGGIMFFWILEGVVPISKLSYHKFRHAGPNLFFTLTTIIVNLAFAFLIVKTSDFVSAKQIGIIHLFEIPIWAQLIIGLMALDLVGAYFIHWIEHKIPFMWKFHVIHHSDEHVDTTTALRHHPGESVFRATFTTLAVLLAGAPMWMVMLYQSCSAILSQFNHSNVKLPKWLDSMLKWIIVTPNMHRIHHHFERPQTDMNYGNIFSFWDRLFKTFHDMPQEDIVFGLDVYEGNTQSLGKLLKVPVEKKSYR